MWSTEATSVSITIEADNTTPKSISFISEYNQVSPHKSEEPP